MTHTSPPAPGLIVHSRRPFNAETPIGRLRAAFVTPVPDFYVRCHGEIPALDAASHRLKVGGRVRAPLELSLAELRARFPLRTVTAVMQCAGNRRAELARVRPVLGDPWRGGAIGNAVWTGVALADVLRAAGVDEGDPSLHAAFSCLDDVEAAGERIRYGASIPLAKALSPEVLLAFEMNGEPLTPEHGNPLRVVVPGYAGARSPKWLVAVEVRDRPSDNHFQRVDYKLHPPHVAGAEAADPEQAMTIYDMPLNSVVCEPAEGAGLPAGKPVVVRGYAVAAAPQRVVRVDVSADGGVSWRQAALERRLEAAPWAWTLWRAELRLPPGGHELAVRAWDSAGRTQPARVEEAWNFRGYLCAAWHRVPVTVR